MRARLIGLACLLAASPPDPPRAADYPNRPVHWLIGFAAGGPVDIVARIMSQWLSDHLGQQFVVENRTGSGGNIAAAAAINSPPDGYTLLFVAPNNAISTSLYKKLPFDFIRDTVPVASIMQLTNMLVVSNAMPVEDRPGVHRLLQGQSRQDLLCLLRQRHLGAHVGRTVQGDDQVRHGARALSRLGARVSRHHLQQGAADLRQSARRRWNRRAAAPCARSASPRRSAGRALPDVPAIAETVPGFESVGFYGISAPKGTPPEIVEILNKAVNEALKDPEAGGAARRDRRHSRSR